MDTHPPTPVRPQRRPRRRVLFISETPARAAARQQLTEACGREVIPVQRPARQLCANPRQARGYDTAVLYQVDFDQRSRVVSDLVRAGVETILVPRYQSADQVLGEARPQVVGFEPLHLPHRRTTP